jgi:hypothetical protein
MNRIELAPATLINVVSGIPSEILRRQETESAYGYIYSMDPVEADWHVAIDITEQLELPNHSSRCIFVAAEPPEIRRYDPAVLSKYGTVLSAPFRYLGRLPNLHPASGLLPWRVGLGIENGYPRVNLSRRDLEYLEPPTSESISVVTSQKAYTRLQVKRLKLIEYLAARIPELEVFGRDTRPIDDKAEALRRGRYHIALENCAQTGFWTEKLSDPILMENVTFYSGRNRWQSDFAGEGAIIEIDVSRREGAYESIRRTLDSNSYEASRKALIANKRAVLEKLNLQTTIEQVINRSNGPQAGTRQGRTALPRHRTRREQWRTKPWPISP